MVKIIDYKLKEAKDGTEYFALVLQGGVEMVQSKESGRFYATARQTSIFSTFNEVMCQGLIGTDLEGEIVKQSCDPYDYQIPNSDDVVTLDYTYLFIPSNTEEPANREMEFVPDVKTFSANEVE